MVSRKKYMSYDSAKHNLIQRGLDTLMSLRSFKDLVELRHNLVDKIRGQGRVLYSDTKIPPILQIEPTNYCNLKCLCCPTSRSTREKGYMDFDLFKKIIDDASQIGVKTVHLYLHGESLRHPKLVEMISYLKTKNLELNLTTNGMLLNKDKIKLILHSGVNKADHLVFSILGYSKEVHETIMRGVNHDIVVNNVFDFVALRKKYNMKGPVIETILHVMPENEHEQDQFINFWQGKVDRVRVTGKISKSFSDYKKTEKSNLSRKRICGLLWDRLEVFWNGDVPICCADVDGDYIIGNLKDQSIKEILNNKQLLSIKKFHRQKQFDKTPLCTGCDL